MTITAGFEVTGQDVAGMRDWVADCEWADDTSNLTDVQVVNGVQRHYFGGVSQFLADAS